MELSVSHHYAEINELLAMYSSASGMLRSCKPLPVEPPTTTTNKSGMVKAEQWLRVGLASGVAEVHTLVLGV